MSKIRLQIAHISIELWSASETQLSFDAGFTHFVGKHISSPDISLEVIPEIPAQLLSEASLVFESQDNTDMLWRVFSYEDGYAAQVFNPQALHKIQAILCVSPHLHSWKLYVDASEHSCVPLAYPTGPLVLYYATSYLSGIMIHASGIIDGERGRIFSGFSGVGKSTMAERWQQNGHTIINDDRLMLTIEGGRVYMYNTPMFYADVPKKQEVHALYLLKQTPEHTIRQVDGVEAVARMLAFCIQHSYNKDIMTHHMNTVSDICEKIRIYELGVALRADIIDFIREHD